MCSSIEPLRAGYYLLFAPLLLVVLVVMGGGYWYTLSSLVFFISVEYILYAVLSNKKELFDVYAIRDLYTWEEE